MKCNKDRRQVFGCALKSRDILGKVKDLADHGRRRLLPINKPIKLTELIGR
jgi:hypothetical protein